MSRKLTEKYRKRGLKFNMQNPAILRRKLFDDVDLENGKLKKI